MADTSKKENPISVEFECDSIIDFYKGEKNYEANYVMSELDKQLQDKEWVNKLQEEAKKNKILISDDDIKEKTRTTFLVKSTRENVLAEKTLRDLTELCIESVNNSTNTEKTPQEFLFVYLMKYLNEFTKAITFSPIAPIVDTEDDWVSIDTTGRNSDVIKKIDDIIHKYFPDNCTFDKTHKRAFYIVRTNIGDYNLKSLWNMSLESKLTEDQLNEIKITNWPANV